MPAGILYGLFIIFSLALLIGWLLLVKKLRRKTQWSSEQLFLVSMGLLAGAIFIIWQVSNAFEGTPAVHGTKSDDEITNFTRQVYKPLVFARQKVDAEIHDMDLLLKNTDDLIDEYPRHAKLLLEVKQLWSRGTFELKKVQKSVDKEVRRAWIAHDTMNQKTVDAKFSRQAVKLEKQINEGLEKFRKLIIKVHNMIRADMKYIQKHITSKHFKRKDVSRNTPRFNSKTTEKLLTFSQTIDPLVHSELLKLIDEIIISEQRQEKVKQHLDSNQDLAEPLVKVIHAWRNAEIDNRYLYNQLLYALESTLMGHKLGLNKKDYAIVSMNKTLKKQIPVMIKKVQDKRQALDNSY